MFSPGKSALHKIKCCIKKSQKIIHFFYLHSCSCPYHLGPFFFINDSVDPFVIYHFIGYEVLLLESIAWTNRKINVYSSSHLQSSNLLRSLTKGRIARRVLQQNLIIFPQSHRFFRNSTNVLLNSKKHQLFLEFCGMTRVSWV